MRWALGVEPRKTLIWFAEQDLAFLRALESHIVPLCKSRPIEPWHVGMTVAGDSVNGERASRARSAELFLALLSADLIASPAFHEEASIAFEKSDRREARIVPIVLRPCDWRSTALADLTPLPPGGAPIGKADNDVAWMEVVEGLRGVLDSMGDPPDAGPGATTGPGASP